MDTLEQAYDEALAVLTTPVSFVEWTTLKVENPATPDPMISDDWSPVGVSMHYGTDDYDWDPTCAIEGERYIYVFSRRAWASDIPTLVEELHLKADGQIEAAKLGPRRFPDPAALDGKDSPLPEKRQWIAVGTAMRFVRRWRGARMLHYFFASRIPLSRRYVEELRQNVALWVPPTTFDDYALAPPTASDAMLSAPSTFGEWDPNVSVDQKQGAMQVPLLDPVTVALHLHLLASSASDDLYDYLTIDETKSATEREHLETRQQKLVLAYVVELVLKDYDTGRGHEMHNVAERTKAYIRQYWEQVNHRIQENERWWFYLSNWYQSDPIHFLARAHYEHPDKHWVSFLMPMLLCLVGANRSVPGRELLKELIDNRDRYLWFHREVLPGYHNDPVEDEQAAHYQLKRKFALAVLEITKEIAPLLIVKFGSTETMWRVLRAHSKHFNIRFMIDDFPMDKNPVAAADKFEHSLKKLRVEVPEGEQIVEEWAEITYHPYEKRIMKLTAVIELLDLTLSLRQFLQERSIVNSLTLARSIGDTSALLLEFANDTRGKFLQTLLKTRPGIIVVAGILEIVVGVIEAKHAAHKHDYMGETSAVITITGAAISTAGFIASAIAGIPAAPFFIVELIVMGIGAIVGMFKDKPMDTFLKFCGFGEDGGGGELVAGLEELKEGEYGQQLEVLLNLLCRFKFRPADVASIDDGVPFVDDGRVARVKMGWIPDGAKLVVDYHDKWRFGPEWFWQHGMNIWDAEEGHTDKVTRTLDFGSGGQSLSADRQFDLVLSKARHFESGLRSPSPFARSYIYNDWSFEAHFIAQLHVAFGEFKFVVPPKPLDFEISGEWFAHDKPWPRPGE